MFTFKRGDFKYVFEYDTDEELDKYLKKVEESYARTLSSEALQKKCDVIKQHYTEVQKIVKKEEAYPKEKSSYNFYDLEVKFVVYKKNLEKVGERSYRAYSTTFNKLKEFFKRDNIDSLTIEDFERFRDYLKSKKLAHKTINNYLSYTKDFVEWGVSRKLIKENNARNVENLAENATKKKKTNYTDKEINNILSFDFEQEFKDIFLIATHTGMRVGEIHALKPESIKQDEETGIYYFDIEKSKTTAGERQVPIHKDILERVLKMKFPLLYDKKKKMEMTDNGAQKAILKQLYRVIAQTGDKTFHTLRGKFMEKCFVKYPKKDYLYTIQEIVGHSKEEKASLSIDTYAKGFHLLLKKEIVDSVSY
ncbi:tyrosine-type recombinase/integrase [Sulfurospirillum multivorans]|uniref:Integrase n=2 Tax=Sulfurospirillum multivorans TaxID=66821 RepID=A0AA86AIL7_SULMK|nr:phage integrase SAM-like domain-containing protein [Sulfurospirillum multivorans]AHJ11330.1 putative integrase [Sulfurospirillum multivorans DSM 12446]QEH04834.1 putative integrase [Sulfurospirillum multivorans]